jgi:heme exporter protein B
MDAQLAAPVDREAIYLGKAIANLLFVAGVQGISLPALALFYNVPLGGVWAPLAGIALLAAVGLVAVGTLFSAMAVNTRLAELLLPMLSLPFFVPIVTSAAQATARLLAGRPAAEAWPWLRILLGFDLVFVVACAIAFPYTLDE